MNEEFHVGDTVYLNKRGFSGWPMEIVAIVTKNTTNGPVEQATCKGKGQYAFSTHTGFWSVAFECYVNTYALRDLTHKENGAIWPNNQTTPKEGV